MKIFLKRANPYNLSDKLGSINYFIRMYSEDLIGDLKAIFRIIMNTVSTFMSHWSQEQLHEHCNAPLFSHFFSITPNMALVYPCFSLTFKNFLLGDRKIGHPRIEHPGLTHEEQQDLTYFKGWQVKGQ